MQGWGKTTVGTTRWRCLKCKTSGVRFRMDSKRRKKKKLLHNWLIGNSNLKDIAAKEKISIRTLWRWFQPLWQDFPKPKVFVPLEKDVLIVDAVYLHKRTHAVLIGRTKQRVIFWLFAERENFSSWLAFFNNLPQFCAVVCDGQKGIILALKVRWPDVVIQRFICHLIRLSLSKLTRSPKTIAGQKLRQIVMFLSKIHTRRQKRRWIRKYLHWEKRYAIFLKEKTVGILSFKGRRRWWYTHRNVRTVKTMIKRALPNLFTYIGHPHIPRSTNYVEGGINSRLKELLHRHRGLSVKKKQVLAAVFLSQKQG